MGSVGLMNTNWMDCCSPSDAILVAVVVVVVAMVVLLYRPHSVHVPHPEHICDDNQRKFHVSVL